MEKTLILGLDLSFNSTGITASLFENNIGKKLRFYKLLFDDQQSKKGKAYTPHIIKNVNQYVYKMPTNISSNDLLIDDDDNDFEQINATLRAMICSKKIISIVFKIISDYDVKNIIISIENFIMPAFCGKNQLKTVSGLIMLNGFVRERLIQLSTKLSEDNQKEYDVKIMVPSPTKIKKFFTGNGRAEKFDMSEAFYKYYNGEKLISISEKGKLDDVIDSFALMYYGYSKLLSFEEIDEIEEL